MAQKKKSHSSLKKEMESHIKKEKSMDKKLTKEDMAMHKKMKKGKC